LPVGFEGEAVAGFGKDFVTNTPAMHVDLWGGRIWMPRRDYFATADVWASGYVNRGAWNGGTTRAALSLFKEAPHGMWTARLAGEQLTDPDPDVRALATIDPTVRALPSGSRFAESAVAISLERSMHLFGAKRGYVVDGAFFVAGSSRWDPTSTTAARVSLGVLGTGLRLRPTRLGSASIRFDVGYPVLAPSSVQRRLFFGVTLSPWIEAGRARQGTATF
jgi:hypothetical protein